MVSPDNLSAPSYRLNHQFRHQSGQSIIMEARPSEIRSIVEHLAAKANRYSPSTVKHRELVSNVCIACPSSIRNPTLLRLLQIYSIPLCHSLICSSAQAVLQNLLGTRVLFRLRKTSEREAVQHEMGDCVRFRDGVPVDDDSSGIPMTATAWHVGMTVSSQAHDIPPRNQTAEL